MENKVISLLKKAVESIFGYISGESTLSKQTKDFTVNIESSFHGINWYINLFHSNTKIFNNQIESKLLSLVKTTNIIDINNGLNLIGVAPERM